MTSNRCFEDVPAGPKRNTSGRYLHQRGAYSGGRRTTNVKGSWAQPTLKPSKSQHMAMQADSARRPAQFSRTGESLVFFFFQNTQGGRERGGDRLTPMSAKKPGLNKEKKPSRPPREFRPYLVWPAGNFFTLPSRFQLCPSSSSAVPSPYCTCSTPCLRQGPQLAGQVVGRR